jgi:two-component system sensor histidine kinase TtrS
MEDSGPGFTEEQKLRSEMPIESTKPEGMGMGLFLARTAAENHRASITFSRSPSLGGAKVTVTFPK